MKRKLISRRVFVQALMGDGGQRVTFGTGIDHVSPGGQAANNFSSSLARPLWNMHDLHESQNRQTDWCGFSSSSTFYHQKQRCCDWTEQTCKFSANFQRVIFGSFCVLKNIQPLEHQSITNLTQTVHSLFVLLFSLFMNTWAKLNDHMLTFI